MGKTNRFFSPKLFRRVNEAFFVCFEKKKPTSPLLLPPTTIFLKLEMALPNYLTIRSHFHCFIRISDEIRFDDLLSTQLMCASH